MTSLYFALFHTLKHSRRAWKIYHHKLLQIEMLAKQKN
jgi:hypothetical protein